MNPKLMARIAETIAQNYDAYDGFVIAHGTDTMAYSAAGITYMLKNLAKPVVFTGSQIPIEALYTDAKKISPMRFVLRVRVSAVCMLHLTEL